MTPRSLAPWTVVLVLVGAAFVALGPGRRDRASAQAVVRVGPVEPIIEMDLAKIDAAYEAREANDVPAFGSLAPAGAPTAQEEEDTAVAVMGVGDTIEGRVVVHDPNVHADEVRVVAIPSGYIGPDHATFTERLSDPEAHGWFVTTCEGDGTFVLGPGLEPSMSYRIAAGGGGVAPARGQIKRRRTGDFVVLDMHRILGVEAIFEDADGRPIGWEGQTSARGWIIDPEHLRQKRAHIADLVLNGLPHYFDSTGIARCFVIDDKELSSSVDCQVALQPYGCDRVLEDAELRPVRDGLHRVTVRAPYPLADRFPLTVHFPESLARDLLGDADRSSLRLWLILKGEERSEIHLEPFVTRDSNEWTANVAEGTYEAELIGGSWWLPVTSAPVQLPLARDDPARRIDVGPEGATIFIPDVARAMVQLDGVEKALGTTPHWLLVNQHLAGEKGLEAQQMIQGRPHRFPVFLHRDEEAKERTFFLGASDLFPLVDKDGIDRFVLSPGDELTLHPIPAETSAAGR